MVPHDLNGIQVILGDVIINDQVDTGNDQFIHHINAFCYRVVIIRFKQGSSLGIQLLQKKGREGENIWKNKYQLSRNLSQRSHQNHLTTGRREVLVPTPDELT